MKTQITSVAVLLALTLSMSFAQPGRGRMGPVGNGPRHEALVDELNLTDAQDLQMKKMRIELRKKQTQIRSTIQTLRLDNQNLFLAEKIDRSAIEKNLKAITDAQQQLKLNMLDHWFAVNNILTPDQQKVWKEHAANMGNHMKNHPRQRVQRMFRERILEGPDSF